MSTSKTCEFCGGVKYHPTEPFSNADVISHEETLRALEKAGEHICKCKEVEQK